MWLWADSRISSSKRNKFVTMVLAKSRKRGIDIAYTVQYFKQVDVRIRAVTDMLCFPRLNSNETKCRIAIYTPQMALMRTYNFKTAPIFALYDTEEEVDELNFEGFS